MGPRSRDGWVDRIFWALLLSVATFGVSEIKGMSSNIAELNTTVRVVIRDISDQAQDIQDLKNRTRQLEMKK